MAWLTVVREHRATRAVTAVADGAADLFHPVLVVARGFLRLVGAAREWWGRTPSDRRGPALFLGGACALVVALTPYGPWLVLTALVGAAAWWGRERTSTPEPTGPTEEQSVKLQALYDALAPCFCEDDDPHPEPLYAPDGSWQQAFLDFRFGPCDRLEQLRLSYPPYFPDEDLESRAKVQRVLTTKAGRDREYHFAWEEEANRLLMSVREPLPSGICAQRFVAAPAETVLGFTDPESTQRTLPVNVDGRRLDVPPLLWRTGPRSTEPHLLALGQPGSGTSNLLRSLAVQALGHGDLLVLDGAGEGGYAFLEGRPGVLAVETSPAGALAALEWAVNETERRLRSARARARELSRPLWILVDRPMLLSHLASAEGRRDPQELLEVPLRHGRGAHVTVALADQLDGAGEGLSAAARSWTRARLVLGQADQAQVRAVLGDLPATSGTPCPQPGRGHARLGNGPVLRFVAPYTPCPYDLSAPAAARAAVESLLPVAAEPPAQRTGDAAGVVD